MFRNIEEDFRFATQVEVQHYSTAELTWKPHMCGFEFSQLLDQLDGQLISSHEAGRKFHGLMWAPGGTALQVARHLNDNGIENTLSIIVNSKYVDSLLLAELTGLNNVTVVATDDASVLNFLDYYPINCNLLFCITGLTDKYQIASSYPQLRGNTTIAYDPDRQLRQKGGRYFMASSTFVFDSG